jgi:hypothetical protein
MRLQIAAMRVVNGKLSKPTQVKSPARWAAMVKYIRREKLACTNYDHRNGQA